MPGEFPYYGPTGVLSYINEHRLDGEFATIGEDGDHFLKYRERPMTLLISGKFNVNNHAHVLASTDKCEASWFANFYMHRELTPYLTRQGAGRYKLTKAALERLPILLPPLPEQRKIAAILSTWDDSLATLTNLLAAKRQQKRGLAEALLTGKKRLPGFEGEWRKEKLSKYVTRTKGKIAPTNKKGLGVPYIGAKSFGGNFEDFTEEVSAVICIREDVLILWDGEYAGNSTTGLEGAVSSTVARLRLSSELNPVFLQSFLQHDIKAIRESRTGSGIPHMPSDFEKWYVIPVPPLPEQQAIASILSALDGEIASLEALKAKVQEQKRGLMDELLTGRIRVRVQE